MTEQQKIVVRLRELARAVEDGKYGSGDDIDTEAFHDDLDEAFNDIGDDDDT